MSTKFITLDIGCTITVQGNTYTVLTLIDLETLVARNHESGKKQLIDIASIESVPTKSTEKSTPIDLSQVTNDEWRTARQRYSAIEPMLNGACYTKLDVIRLAKNGGVHASTLYRWVDLYQSTGTLVSLVPKRRYGGERVKRIDPEVEKVIEAVINKDFLNDKQAKVETICVKVDKACRGLGLPAPHHNTVRKRIHRIPGRIVSKRRGGKKAAEKFEPASGHFPDPGMPLHIVQIDHTLIDIEIVDEKFRRPIGRPWITLAIDVETRVVTGMYLTLDAPSGVSVGQAIYHSLMPKEDWLAERGIEGKWPIWGKPVAFHADNGSDFRADDVTAACHNNQMDIYWRPVARPKYGGHIERLIGNLNAKLRDMPGRTGNSIRDRGAHNPEKSAAFTLSELEAWIATYFIDHYHKRIHSGMGQTPLRAYEIGIYGDEHKPGRGLPPRIADTRGLYIDFLPTYKRTVQQYGIKIQKVSYYSNALRNWINECDPDNPKSKRKFVVKQDPRRISPVYFYDPDLRDYIEVPYADLARPAISLSELKAAQRKLRDEGLAHVDEDALFNAVERLDKMQIASAEKTKRARRSQQKQASNKTALQRAEGVLQPIQEIDHNLEHGSPPEALPIASVVAYEEIEEFDD